MMLSCQFMIYSLHLTEFTSYDDVQLSLLAEVELTLISRWLFSSSTNLPSGKRAGKPPKRAHVPSNWNGRTEKIPRSFVCLSAFMTLLAFPTPIPHVRIFRGEQVKYQTSHFILQICVWHMTTVTCFVYGAEPPSFQRTMLGFLFPYDDSMMNSVCLN